MCPCMSRGRTIFRGLYLKNPASNRMVFFCPELKEMNTRSNARELKVPCLRFINIFTFLYVLLKARGVEVHPLARPVRVPRLVDSR